jgi:long-chain-fatty-acid--CoA ligase ACSBG
MSIDVHPSTSWSSITSLSGPVLHSGESTATFLQPTSTAHTVSELFLKTVQEKGNQEACRITQPEDTVSPQGTGTSAKKYSVIQWKWNEYGDAAIRFAKALIAQDIGPQEVVTIQGANSPQWLSAHIGTILAGGVSAGVYPTNGKELCEHIVTSSGAKVAIVEDDSQLKKYEALQSTALKCIVVWDKHHVPSTSSVPVLTMEEFLKSGEAIPDTILKARVGAQKPEDPCTLVYTSGTTGNPKAAALTHANLTKTASCAVQKFSLDPTHRAISFLPLSHVAPLLLDCMAPIVSGHSVYISPPDVLKGCNLKDHLIQAKPTYFLGVPRVWEKFKEGIEAQLKTAPFILRKFFAICTTIGRALCSDYHFLSVKQITAPLPIHQKIRRIFDHCILCFLDMLLFRKIKAALGLDKCLLPASGAGSLDPAVRDFFKGLNLHILDVYGMSESTGPITLPDFATPEGSCGKPTPGTEVKIINPDENGEGEILARGPNVFAGYWHDSAASQDTLDENRFLHTGDKGKLDAQGYLYVTGRVKEIIKTSGGENIPPLKIEDKIKEQLSIVSQAVVIGNNRHFLTCLLTLKTVLNESGQPTDKLAPEVIEEFRKINSSATTLQEAAADPKVLQFLMQGIQRANQKADSHAQYVQKIKVLPEDFSVTNGMLTPTLKLRRPIIEKKYQKEIEEMYAV